MGDEEKANPKVSVVMTAYNASRTLAQSINSILDQSFSDLELIVVDDGSTDMTPHIMSGYRDPRIVYSQNEENVGQARSLNRGLLLARGEFIARQDADDVSRPQRLEKQLQFMQENPDVGLLGTAYEKEYGDGRRDGPHRMPLHDTGIRWKLLFDQAFCHTTVMLRRSALDKAEKWYDESLQYGQDYEFWSRLSKHTKGANLEESCAVLRIHDSRIGKRQRREQQIAADAIAWRNLCEVVPDAELSLEDAAQLRRIYYCFPEPFCVEDVPICRTFFEIFEAFSQLPEVDSGEIEKIQEHLDYRVQKGIPAIFRAPATEGA